MESPHKILLLFLLLVGALSAQLSIKRVDAPGQTVRVVEAGRDMNANGRFELLTIHDPVDTLAPSEAVYYEHAGPDSLAVLWRYRLDASTLSRIVDAGITDLDGDGLPEITILLHVEAQADTVVPAWLRVFAWDTAAVSFSAHPSLLWDYRGRGTSYLRPRQLAIADLDGDGDDELVIPIGSPDRMLLVADMGPDGLRARDVLRPKPLMSGPWPLSVALADFNGDQHIDFLAIGDGRPPKLLAYISGPDGLTAMPIALPAGARLRPGASTTGDLNGDGQQEVILSHLDGSLTLVSIADTRLRATVLATQLTNLVDLAAIDLDGDGTTELIYLADDGTISTNDARFIAPLTSAQLLTQLPPAGRSPVYSSFVPFYTLAGDAVTVALPIQTDQGILLALADMSELALQSVPVVELGEPTPAEPLSGPDEPQTEGRAVYLPELPIATDPRALPPHQTPDYLLYVGDEFLENVLADRAEQFSGFRFIQKAPGMVFNFQRQSIVWQPTEEQMGAWHVAYEITFYQGVRPEAAVTDSVLLSETVLFRDRMLLYVNDRPTITSQPENLNLLAGSLFAYRVVAHDANPDARLDFRLESGPKEMFLDHNGILNWRTNETHHDDYQVVVSVSDGFDKDVQTFTLNVNARLTITSAGPRVAHINKPYRYQVAYFQPGAPRQQVFSLSNAPDGMTIDPSGLISWTPAPSQIDTQRYRVRISDGTAEDVQDGWVLVNAQPKIVSGPQPAVVVLAGDSLQLSFRGRDPNAGQRLRWDLASGPVDMTIDSSGNLLWPTTYRDLNESRYVVTLSDGIDETRFRGIVFVNSPISVTSVPPDSVIVGRQYRYPITIRDENTSSLLKYRRPTVVTNIARTVGYEVELQDDKIRRDLPRYLAQFREMKNIYVNKPRRPAEGEVAQAARIDLKQHVKHAFVEEGKLVLVIHSPEQGFVELEDVLWELFQGGRGIMPKYTAERIPFVHYSLRSFPDGMTVDDDGLLTWSPSLGQAGYHQVRLSVSDGFTRDDQAFQIYANYPPAIISQPDTLAISEQRFSYQVRVDDKNTDAQLSYRLIQHPDGMQIDARGMVTWLPSLEQLNWQQFEVEVSDGHAVDRQAATLFVNMLPRIISQPRPVALNNFEYRYRLVAEDLNSDEFQYHATRLPRYSDFNTRTGLFKWRPRDIQKGANDVVLEVIDSHGGVTVHEFQVHVFEDPSRRQFLFTGWPLMLAFVGIIFVLGVAAG